MNAARSKRHAVFFGSENDLGVGGRSWWGLGQTNDGVGQGGFLPRCHVSRKDPYPTRCDTDCMHVTAMLTVITVQLPV